MSGNILKSISPPLASKKSFGIFNLLFYYLIEDKRVFLILEEPESHLYPSSQRSVGELLGLFLNDEKNAELITTHSPYLLGTFNYMLQARGKAKVMLPKRLNRSCANDIGLAQNK